MRGRAGMATWLAAIGCGALPLFTMTTRASAQADDGQSVPVDVPQGDAYADTDPSALTDFRAALDPHGTWVDDPTYGTAWTPNPDEVGADFAPYDTAGQWDYVDGDYTWVSDYDWGWVCFHYGRWVESGGMWLWIPGRDYAPAWVAWFVVGGDASYLGWAPTPPAWGWSGGVAVGLGFSAPEPYTFAPGGNVFGPGLPSRVVTGQPAAALASRSRPYVRAQPGIAGRAFLQPVVHGPPPSLFGIDVAVIPHARVNPRELRARQLAHPSTALPLGAHAPAPHVYRAPSRQALPRRSFGVAPRSGGHGRR